MLSRAAILPAPKLVLLQSSTVVVAMKRGRLVEPIGRGFGRALSQSAMASRIHRSAQPAFGTVQSMHFTTSKDNNNNNNNNNNTLLQHGAPQQRLNTIYVHPLSQLVLASLQTQGHEWIVRHKLDRCLTIHRDGTFVLEPKPQQQEKLLLSPDTTTENKTGTAMATATSTSADPTTTTTTTTAEREESLQPKVEATISKGRNAAPSDGDDDAARRPKVVCSDASQPLQQGLRIWTSYDPVDKKHWLSVQLAATVAAKKTGVAAAAAAAAALTRENDPMISSSGNNNNVLVRRFLLQDNLLPAWHGGGASRHKSLPERIQEMVDQVMILVDDNYYMSRQQQQQRRNQR